VKGAIILLVFFLLFTSASLLIPSPLFPGNVFCALIGENVSQYAGYLSAFFNGLFYGGILWLIFLSVGKKLGAEK
jgi:hypothetical protein